MSNHLYSATVSNLSASNLRRKVTSVIPQKYFDCYISADMIASCEGALTASKTNAGSGEIYFVMDATKANALRKWFQRRFKGRSKFARQIVPMQFCACLTSSSKGGV